MTIGISIDTLIIQAAQGDLKAFEEIYNAFSGFVYSVALRVTNNKPDAEEVTQDVFMQISRGLKNFKFKSSFKTWVYRITFNTAINKYRHGQRERNRVKAYENEAAAENYYNKDARLIDEEHAEKTVSSLLDKLNPNEKSAIILREIQGLSYKEIADALKLNINTVRSRLKRARESILESARKGVIGHEL